MMTEIRAAPSGGGALTGEGHEGTFWAGENVPYLDLGGGYAM